ncbi:MAG: hypothetical protein WDM91_09390 [Rhizomicrobium sp.]
MWKTLGIAPTTDAKAIRRAYAQKLRALGPDPDARSFQTLRRAFEGALHHAERGAVAVLTAQEDAAAVAEEIAETPATPPAVPVPQPRPTPVPAPAAPPEPDEATLLVHAMDAALRDRRYADAFEVNDRGLANGAFTFGAREYLAERILAAMTADPAIAGGAFIAAMQRVGWDVFPKASDRLSRARNAASAKLEAELWYRNIAALAGGIGGRKRRGEPDRWWHRWIARRRTRRVAAIVAGKPAWFNVAQATTAELKARAAEFAYYAKWLGDRGRPAAVARIERVLRRDAVLGRAARIALMVLIAIPIVGAGLGFLVGGGPIGIGVAAMLGFRYLFGAARRR